MHGHLRTSVAVLQLDFEAGHCPARRELHKLEMSEGWRSACPKLCASHARMQCLAALSCLFQSHSAQVSVHCLQGSPSCSCLAASQNRMKQRTSLPLWCLVGPRITFSPQTSVQQWEAESGVGEGRALLPLRSACIQSLHCPGRRQHQSGLWVVSRMWKCHSSKCDRSGAFVVSPFEPFWLPSFVIEHRPAFSVLPVRQKLLAFQG